MNNCTDCKGKGKIELMTSFVECELCNGTGNQYSIRFKVDPMDQLFQIECGPPTPMKMPKRPLGISTSSRITACYGTNYRDHVDKEKTLTQFKDWLKEAKVPITTVDPESIKIVLGIDKPSSYHEDIMAEQQEELDQIRENASKVRVQKNEMTGKAYPESPNV